MSGVGLAGWAIGCRAGDLPNDTGTHTDTDTDTEPADTDTAQESCDPTPEQTEGPFWVEGVPVRENLDLYGETAERLTLEGSLQGADCAPIANGVVEIWHADASGDYDNDSPEMRYRGQTATDAEGRWRFQTIRPGKYEPRPLHIHVKAWVDGEERFTSQIYFEDDAQSASEPDSLRIPLEADGSNSKIGFFAIVLTEG